MYMSVPTSNGMTSLFGAKQKVSLTEVVTPLEGKLSGEEYNKCWQKKNQVSEVETLTLASGSYRNHVSTNTKCVESFAVLQRWLQELRYSGKDLENLYEDCKQATFAFKDKYDEIKKSERLKEALRLIYYEALSTKKKHEEDRDNYFKCESELKESKENFVEESQKLALSASKYVELNQRFATRREQLIVSMLSDVSKVNKENERIKEERNRISNELGKQKTMVYELRANIEKVEIDYHQLEERCKSSEQSRDRVKKEVEWAMRQNNKLKEANARCERELLAATRELEEAKRRKKEDNDREAVLQDENKTLQTRLTQLQQNVEAFKATIETMNEKSKQREMMWEEKLTRMQAEVEDAQKKLTTSRINNHNTIVKNQQLREKLASSSHRADKVTTDKLKSVLVEHKTRKRNVELASHQVQLINEILELKEDFFRDQARIREGAKLNRRLEKNLNLLRQRMQMVKENPVSVDPLEGAQEHRERIARKYGAQVFLL